MRHGSDGIFDLSRRFDGLDRKDHPLARLSVLVPWETFRPKLETALAEHDLPAFECSMPINHVRA